MVQKMEQGKRTVVIVSLVTALCLLGDAMLYVVLPMCWQEVGLTSWWEVGVVLSMNRLVRLPLNPFGGWVYQSFPVKVGLTIAVILGVVTTLGYAVASSFAVWVLLRAVWGVSWTLLRLGGYYIVIESSDAQNRGRYMGMYNGLHRLGNLVGTLLGGILADLLGYRVMAGIFGILTVGAFLPLSMLRQEASIAIVEKKGAVRLPREAWMRGSFLWLMATGLIVAMLYQGMLATILSPLTAVHTAPIAVGIGMVLGAATIGGLLQAVRWGWEPWGAPWIGQVSDKFGSRSGMLVVSFALTAVLFAMMTCEVPMAIWILIVLGVQMGGTSLTTLADSAAADCAAQTGRMAVMTWFSFAIDLGSAIGPLFALALVSYGGLHTVCLVGAALLAVFALYWNRNRTHRSICCDDNR